MNVKVENMVCPLCARRHGEDHADGCPKLVGEFGAYEHGWREATAHMGKALAWEHDKRLRVEAVFRFVLLLRTVTKELG